MMTPLPLPLQETSAIRLIRLAKLTVSLFAFLLMGGCQTTAPSFPSPGVDWQTFQGQLHYTSALGKSIIGDVVIRRSPRGDFQLEFQSGPGFPLMRLWESGNVARAEGILARGSWQGAPESAPRYVLGWVRLRESFAKPGQPTHLAASFEGDRFDFHFGR